jgi:rRNA 2'-O-methyltransferase fibrillarin
MKKRDQESLMTRSFFPGESVYGEKRVSVMVACTHQRGDEKVEYRTWTPYRSKIAAAIAGGINALDFGPGSKVLYLGASTGTTCSHVSDIIGPTGILYAVEFSPRCGRELLNMAKRRTNVVPIIMDARKPQDYRYLVEMVDFVFADVAQPNQASIMGINCKYFLKNGGKWMIAIKVAPPHTGQLHRLHART